MSDTSKTDNTFQDPLENYDPKTYTDALEKAIAEESVIKIQHQPYATIGPDATLSEAVTRLALAHIACLLVEEDGKLVGVFTEREVVNKIALEGDLSQVKVSDVMTPDPVYVHADAPVAAALCVMAVNGFRHVPIVDSDNRIVGIVSPHRVTGFLARYFSDSTA